MNFSIGTIIEDVCPEEKVPVDIQKIKPIQIKTGSQYLHRIMFKFARLFIFMTARPAISNTCPLAMGQNRVFSIELHCLMPAYKISLHAPHQTKKGIKQK